MTNHIPLIGGVRRMRLIIDLKIPAAVPEEVVNVVPQSISIGVPFSSWVAGIRYLEQQPNVPSDLQNGVADR